MKTTRRHELQTNALAQSLGRWVEAIKPYSRAIVAGLIAVVVAVFVWAYLSTQSTRRQTDGWNEYFNALSGQSPDPRESLRDISSRYSGSMVGQWARLTLADIQLDQGTNRLLVDRRMARDELRQASEEFQALRLEATHPTVLQRATYGLARAYEALGELDRAGTEYRALAEKWSKGPFAKVAQRRATDLEERSTRSFYDWLAKYEPPPPLSGEPGTAGARPDFLEEPDKGGILEMPSVLDNQSGPALPSSGDEPADTAPQADKPAADESPENPDPEAVPGDASKSPSPGDDEPPSGNSETSSGQPEENAAPKSDEAGPKLK